LAVRLFSGGPARSMPDSADDPSHFSENKPLTGVAGLDACAQQHFSFVEVV
jgi:hypothetical protein